MQAQAKAKVQSFMSQHPELQTDEMFKGEVRKTLLANENLTLQDAYWIVKGQQSHQTAERHQMQQLAFQQAAQAAGLKVGAGQHKGITIPKNSDKMSASDLYNHLLKQKK
jgi:aspartate aminotransferase-like enzyme